MSYFLKKVVGTIGLSVVWLFSVFFVYDEISRAIHWGMDEEKGYIFALIFFLIISVVLFFYIRSARCKKCGKFFSYRKIDTSRVKSEDISVKVELNDYNTRHEVKGTHEQYIAGTRDTYRICYRCKNCGNEFYKKFSEDKQKI